MLAVLLAFVLFIPASTRFYCGLDPYTNTAFEFFILLDCKEYHTQHQACCMSHGECYVNKTATQEECDNQYCACLLPLTEVGGLCQFHADNFCLEVKAVGYLFYPIITDVKWGLIAKR